MSIIQLNRDLPFDVKTMVLNAFSMKSENISKIQHKFAPLNNSNIDWSIVDRSTWFICINSTTNKGYYFPIQEIENRENDYIRVKNGMKYFISQGWNAYKIQQEQTPKTTNSVRVYFTNKKFTY